MGLGARLPRLSALYVREKTWKLLEQNNPEDWQEDLAKKEASRDRTIPHLQYEDKVVEVLEDQAARGKS